MGDKTQKIQLVFDIEDWNKTKPHGNPKLFRQNGTERIMFTPIEARHWNVGETKTTRGRASMVLMATTQAEFRKNEAVVMRTDDGDMNAVYRAHLPLTAENERKRVA